MGDFSDIEVEYFEVEVRLRLINVWFDVVFKFFCFFVLLILKSVSLKLFSLLIEFLGLIWV